VSATARAPAAEGRAWGVHAGLSCGILPTGCGTHAAATKAATGYCCPKLPQKTRPQAVAQGPQLLHTRGGSLGTQRCTYHVNSPEALATERDEVTMTFWEATLGDFEDLGFDLTAPHLSYEMFSSSHRGAAGWHMARRCVLCNCFHLKLFSLCRAPRKNAIKISKKPWLADDYATTIEEGLLEQIVGEEAARLYEGLKPLSVSMQQSMRAVLDEYPTAAKSVPSELVESARELGMQAGLMIDLWNRVLDTDRFVLRRLGVSDISAQSKRDAVLSFITFFRVTGNILARTEPSYLEVGEYESLLADYVAEN